MNSDANHSSPRNPEWARRRRKRRRAGGPPPDAFRPQAASAFRTTAGNGGANPPQTQRHVAAVPREQVVAPRPRHLNAVVAGAFGNQQRVDRRRIGLRLVEVPEHALQVRDDLRTDDDLAQVRVQGPGHAAGVRQVGGAAVQLAAVAEPDGVAARPVAGPRVAHRGHHAARVEAAGQEGPDRHVAHHLPRHRLPEQSPQGADEFLFRVRESGAVVRQVVMTPLAGDAAAAHEQSVPGFELAHRPENGTRRDRPQERQVLVQGVPIEVAGHVG